MRIAKQTSSDYENYVVDNNERNYLIYRLAKYCWKKGHYIIILVERVRHLSILSRRFDKVGIPHKVVSGTFRGKHIKVKERMKSKDRFEKGKIRLIIANKVFKKGINVKRVDVIIDAAGMSSKEDAIQKFGRGVRLHHDKLGLMYFDIADRDEKPRTIYVKNKKKEFKKTGKRYKKKKKYNRFHKATQNRKNAFRHYGIRMQEIEWNENIKEIYHAGKTLLQKQRKHKKSKSTS